MSSRGPIALGLVAAALGGGAAAAAATSAPRVETMIVGRTRTLFAPRGVRAGATTVPVGAKRCAVGTATPLAALAGAARAGGPSFRTRDYGACSRSARNSASLFVFAVGRDVNRGRDGWVYKVNGHIGTTGAADPSGPLGNGRLLRGGDQLAWFWCNADVHQRCQRTLAIRLGHTGARPGSAVLVTVVGYDDDGRAVAIRGARVTLGSEQAVTGAGGMAALRAPAGAGRYTLDATAAGLVPAFPAALTVA